jgi:hypothetical protein
MKSQKTILPEMFSSAETPFPVRHGLPAMDKYYLLSAPLP